MTRLAFRLVLWGMGLFFGVDPARAATPPTAVFRFDELHHDFGVIDEEAGPVSHTFCFTNISDQALVIERVLTTCGCTVVDYNREPILPGKTGAVSVRFDPRGRTNTFYKSVRVVTNGGRNVTSLFISGTIRLRDTPPESLYEISDDVYLNRLVLPFGVIQHGALPTSQSIEICNRSDRAIRLAALVEGGIGGVEVSLPSRVAAGGTARIVVHTVDVPDFFGSLACRIRIRVDDVVSSVPIDVYGYLVDDMRGMRIPESPVCKVEGGYFNFGKIRSGTRLQHEFRLRNEGHTPLFVRKVECPACMVSDFEDERILLPGDTLAVHLTMNFRELGEVDANICIITNDVKRPVLRLKIEGTVE